VLLPCRGTYCTVHTNKIVVHSYPLIK
jgi:hypothetical protein